MQGRLENELKQNKKINEKLNNVPEYVRDWYMNLKASNKTSATCRDYINKILKFLYSINENICYVKLSDINLSNTQKFFISIQTKEKNGEIVYTSDSYQQTIWCCLNNFFDYLLKTHQIEDNYIQLISKPKNNDLERINENRILLTKKDFKKIIKSVEQGTGTDRSKSYQNKMKNRDLSIILLLMTTGMRCTALTEINIEDLDLENGYLHIIDKGDKRHTYNLSESTIDSLNNWLEDREEWNSESNALFVSNNTNRRMTSSAISDLVDKYCEDALGYHVSPHKLRAGFCSILYKETGNAEFVRRAVGHSNIATTQRYIVTSNNERKEASNIISDFLF